MRPVPRLGAVNFALVAIYFVPAWGVDALRVLRSPFAGFEDRAHAAAASAIRQVFDLGLEGLLRTSNLLAATKLVVTAGFVAYLIEFSRALVMGREPNRETTDIVLMAALVSVVLWSVPALALDDVGLIRLHATQLLLIVSAVVVITIERHIEERHTVPAPPTRAVAPQPSTLDLSQAIPGATGYKARLLAWRAARSEGLTAR
jgi:hypothetical protein